MIKKKKDFVSKRGNVLGQLERGHFISLHARSLHGLEKVFLSRQLFKKSLFSLIFW